MQQTTYFDNVKLVLAKSGLTAVFARRWRGEPWVQVDAMMHPETFAEAIDADPAERAQAIETAPDASAWGDDAPPVKEGGEF